MVRNPHSVVYSIHNWSRAALDRLYDGCEIPAGTVGRLRRRLPWPIGPSRIEKACLACNAKAQQIEQLREWLPPAQLLVIEYDRMIGVPAASSSMIFNFINEPYDGSYVNSIRSGSTKKGELPAHVVRELITSMCARLL